MNVVKSVWTDNNVVLVRLHHELHAHVVHDVVVDLLRSRSRTFGDSKKILKRPSVNFMMLALRNACACGQAPPLWKASWQVFGALTGDDLTGLSRIVAHHMFRQPHVSSKISRKMIKSIFLYRQIDTRQVSTKAGRWRTGPITQPRLPSGKPAPLRASPGPFDSNLVALDRLQDTSGSGEPSPSRNLRWPRLPTRYPRAEPLRSLDRVGYSGLVPSPVAESAVRAMRNLSPLSLS